MKDLTFLQIETTNLCNSHCVFCVHHKFEKFGTMTDELYEKIIQEASELPRLQLLTPHLTGEPLCDSKYVERIEYARERMPWVTIEIYTNGSLLTRPIIDRFKKIPNLHISISLNGITPETRKAVMGLDDYWYVLAMMKYMDEIGVGYRATMVYYPEIRPVEVKAFVDAGGMAIQYQSWCGEQYPYERRRWTSCGRALNYMTVLYTGEVNLCCFDPFGKVIFGDLNKETIEEVWTSTKHRELQSLHKQGRGAEYELCGQCTEG